MISFEAEEGSLNTFMEIFMDHNGINDFTMYLQDLKEQGVGNSFVISNKAVGQKSLHATALCKDNFPICEVLVQYSDEAFLQSREVVSETGIIMTSNTKADATIAFEFNENNPSSIEMILGSEGIDEFTRYLSGLLKRGDGTSNLIYSRYWNADSYGLGPNQGTDLWSAPVTEGNTTIHMVKIKYWNDIFLQEYRAK